MINNYNIIIKSKMNIFKYYNNKNNLKIYNFNYNNNMIWKKIKIHYFNKIQMII